MHKEIAPEPKPHNLHYKGRDDDARHAFLRSLMGSEKNKIPREEFKEIVRGWKVPSMHPDKKAEESHKDYMRKMNIGRRIRAYWNVRGPEMCFLALVVSLQIGMGTWQFVKYLTGRQYTSVSTYLGSPALVLTSDLGIWMGRSGG